MPERISFYKKLTAQYQSNDHMVCLKLGEHLHSKYQIDRNSEEELAVAYYNRCVNHTQHSTQQPRLKNAGEILLAIEGSYARDYGCSLQEFN
ncbi:hypothetical protein ACFVS2_25155 [Brevibacillus sp. NPDC058079]|uniref:hypothetical protein n=1 Tax=Brevibacillus sp. NPDC058079 TaxID=3346330 RepID=UPI0036DFF7B0